MKLTRREFAAGIAAGIAAPGYHGVRGEAVLAVGVDGGNGERVDGARLQVVECRRGCSCRQVRADVAGLRLAIKGASCASGLRET